MINKLVNLSFFNGTWNSVTNSLFIFSSVVLSRLLFLRKASHFIIFLQENRLFKEINTIQFHKKSILIISNSSTILHLTNHVLNGCEIKV